MERRSGARLRIPSLTVLWHPDLSRVGERVRLTCLAAWRAGAGVAHRPTLSQAHRRARAAPRSPVDSPGGVPPGARHRLRRRPALPGLGAMHARRRRPGGGGRGRAGRRPHRRGCGGRAGRVDDPPAPQPARRGRRQPGGLRAGRRERQPGRAAARGAAGGGPRGAGPAARRDRHRQGADGPGDPPRRPPPGRDLHLGQPGGDSGVARRLRAVRLGQGGLHRVGAQPRGLLRPGRRRHPVPGRGGRGAAGGPGDAAAGARDRRDPAAGSAGEPAGRRAADRRHRLEPRGGDRRGQLQGAPAAPALRLRGRGAAAARPARRLRPAVRPLPGRGARGGGGVRAPGHEPVPLAADVDRRPPGVPRLARQHPPAQEHGPAARDRQPGLGDGPHRPPARAPAPGSVGAPRANGSAGTARHPSRRRGPSASATGTRPRSPRTS